MREELDTLPQNALAQDSTSLTMCSPKIGKELTTLLHNAVARDGTSLTIGSPTLVSNMGIDLTSLQYEFKTINTANMYLVKFP